MIETIIFDLGGVILNLDEQQTINKFARLSSLDYRQVNDRILKFETYFDLEMGKVSEKDFRQAVRTEFSIEATDDQIDECMNAMLLDIPKERLDLLERLKSQYNLYLLSNTNSIHLRRFNQIVFESVGLTQIDAYFLKAYYSHLVGLRKPNTEIFDFVIQENKLDQNKTLFIDDNQNNIEGALKTGLKAHHLTNPTELFEIFK